MVRGWKLQAGKTSQPSLPSLPPVPSSLSSGGSCRDEGLGCVMVKSVSEMSDKKQSRSRSCRPPGSSSEPASSTGTTLEKSCSHHRSGGGHPPSTCQDTEVTALVFHVTPCLGMKWFPTLGWKGSLEDTISLFPGEPGSLSRRPRSSYRPLTTPCMKQRRPIVFPVLCAIVWLFVFVFCFFYIQTKQSGI